MHDKMARKRDHNIILWFGLESNHPKHPTALQEKAVMDASEQRTINGVFV